LIKFYFIFPTVSKIVLYMCVYGFWLRFGMRAKSKFLYGTANLMNS